LTAAAAARDASIPDTAAQPNTIAPTSSDASVDGGVDASTPSCSHGIKKVGQP